MKSKMSAILDQLRPRRRNTKKRDDAKDHIKQHKGSDENSVQCCESSEYMEERHGKVETKGKSCKI